MLNELRGVPMLNEFKWQNMEFFGRTLPEHPEQKIKHDPNQGLLTLMAWLQTLSLASSRRLFVRDPEIVADDALIRIHAYLPADATSIRNSLAWTRTTVWRVTLDHAGYSKREAAALRAILRAAGFKIPDHLVPHDEPKLPCPGVQSRALAPHVQRPQDCWFREFREYLQSRDPELVSFADLLHSGHSRQEILDRLQITRYQYHRRLHRLAHWLCYFHGWKPPANCVAAAPRPRMPTPQVCTSAIAA